MQKVSDSFTHYLHLRSAFYSCRIEGNTLTWENVLRLFPFQSTNLLPRRKEILEIINDHLFCTLDLIARCFPTIPRRTLGFDVNDLLKKKLIVKNGTTRGVTYSAK